MFGCGCYLGFPLSPYGKQLQNNLQYNTSSNNIYRIGAIHALDYKLANLMAEGFQPKASYFNVNPFNVNDSTVKDAYSGLYINPWLYSGNADCCMLSGFTTYKLLQ